MTEKPILFSGAMVKAIMEGRKTQTRRVIKLSDGSLCDDDDIPAHDNWDTVDYIMDFSKTYPYWKQLDCPYGKAGDTLWVREKWQGQEGGGQWWHEIKEHRELYNWAWTNPVEPAYDAVPPRWLPSIHMPRMACRITLEVVKVRVERVQDIDNHQSWWEGIPCLEDWPVDLKPHNPQRVGWPEARDVFAHLWDSINAGRGYGWDVNPWVWVVEFKVNR